MTTKFKIMVYLLLTVHTVGCAPLRDQATPTQKATPTRPLTTVSPTITLTLAPTETPTRTAPPATPTFSPTPTITRSVPLGPEEAKQAIQKLLRENVECASPCFWGIIPDQTTLGEAQNIFHRLAIPLQKSDSAKNEIYTISYGFSNGLTIGVMLWVEESIVTNIQTDIGLSNYTGSPTPRVWVAFSPEMLIREYGIPTRVSLNLTYPAEAGFPPGTAWYHMVMYFASSNLFAEYHGGLTQAGKLVRACPLADRFDNIRIWLGKHPEYPPLEELPLEKVTSLTLEQFSDLLTGDPGAACFSIKADTFIP